MSSQTQSTDSKTPISLKSIPTEANTEASTTPASGSGLIHDVRQLMMTSQERKDDLAAERDTKQKDHDKRVQDSRQKGSNALFEHLRSLVPEKVKTYAGYNKTEARVFEFTFGAETKFEGCYAKDLLTKGSVMKQLQDWLDTEHADQTDGQKGRAFFAYFNMVGRHQHDRANNKYAVFINWDRTSWEAIQQRLEQSAQVRGQRGDGKRPFRGQRQDVPRPQSDQGSQDPSTERPKTSRGPRQDGAQQDRPQYDRPQYDRPRQDRPRGPRPQKDDVVEDGQKPRGFQGSRPQRSPRARRPEQVPIAHTEA